MTYRYIVSSKSHPIIKDVRLDEDYQRLISQLRKIHINQIHSLGKAGSQFVTLSSCSMYISF